MINVDTTSESWYYYHTDALGSVVALSNSSGMLQERYKYYMPFGTPYVYDANGSYTGSTSVYSNPYMFTARRYDSETGLYYYRARMYSPTLGRFLQTDPLGYYDSMNLYQYCLNNPGNYTDPKGEAILTIFVIAIGVRVGIDAAVDYFEAWEAKKDILRRRRLDDEHNDQIVSPVDACELTSTQDQYRQNASDFQDFVDNMIRMPGTMANPNLPGSTGHNNAPHKVKPMPNMVGPWRPRPEK